MRRCLHGICVDFDSIGGGKNGINGFFLHVKGEQEEGGERCAPGDEMSGGVHGADKVVSKRWWS
ncbi:hypothetical protein PMAC_003395 [Pneumocystis sp. 'macacae']|nr:hypothetical protein PMAC_003395 [Pneumocystis sp. 'macacae']